MPTWVFYIYLLYGLPIICLYLLTLIILKYTWKQYSTSYFQFYTFEFVMNMITILNVYHSIRMPSVTCNDCLLADYYRRDFMKHSTWFNRLQYALQFHMAYVQYFTTSVVAFNRLTIAFFEGLDVTWRKYSWFLMLVIVISPSALTYKVFYHKAIFEYDAILDRFSLNSDLSVSQMLTFLFPVIIATTGFTLAANVLSVFRIKKIPTKSRYLHISRNHTHRRLFFLGNHPGIWSYHHVHIDVCRAALPIASDLLSMSQPCLVMVCSTLIRKYMSMIFKGPSVRVIPAV